MMGKRRAILSLLVALCVSAGCNGTEVDIRATGPSGFGVTAPFIGVNPAVVSPQSVHDAFCPTLPPFLAGINLSIRVTGDVGVTLREVRMQFTDQTGITAPQVTLPAPVLTQQFGTTLVQGRSERTFPLAFRFGCGTARAGTIVMFVVTGADQDSTDSNFNTRQLQIQVR
jgi:hypothetical protein